MLAARAPGAAFGTPRSPRSRAARLICAAGAPPRLTYFAITGRAEVARLLFTLGGTVFEDNRIGFDEWPALKATAKSPFGQLPFLEVDGKVIAQSGAIDHYAAKLAGLYPEDPLQAALADQAYFFCEDVLQTLVPTFRISDPAEQVAARQQLLEGSLKEKLDLMAKLLEGKSGTFLLGEKMSIADVAVFNQLSFLKSGLMAGIPVDVLDRWPVLKAFRNTIASLPEVVAYYSQATDDARKIGYTPDP